MPKNFSGCKSLQEKKKTDVRRIVTQDEGLSKGREEKNERCPDPKCSRGQGFFGGRRAFSLDPFSAVEAVAFLRCKSVKKGAGGEDEDERCIQFAGLALLPWEWRKRGAGHSFSTPPPSESSSDLLPNGAN